MKHRYNIKVDAPVPSDAQIARHQNFDRVYQNYQQLTQPIYRKPLYKNPKAFIGLVLIGAISFLVFRAVEEEEKPREGNTAVVRDSMALPPAIAEAEARSFLKPPVAGAEPAAFEVSLDPMKERELRLPDGTTLTIPKGAFVKPEGDVVIDPVNFTVRLLRDPLDFALAGVPLEGPEGAPLNVSGVFVMEARLGDERLVLDNRTPIQVDLRVTPRTPSMRVYHLDQGARQWEDMKGEQVVARLPEPVQEEGGDGFGVVEFGPNGKPVPKTTAKPGADKPAPMVQSFAVGRLGVTCLGQELAAGEVLEKDVRLMDGAGKPLELYAVYCIVPGQNTIRYFWPRTADFQFHLQYPQGAKFFGFLPDGRVAWIGAEAISSVSNLPGKPADLRAEVSQDPVQDKAALKQLLSL